MWPIEEGRLSNITCTWPEMRSTSAGPAPLYGTCSILQPVIIENISPDMCTDVPVPDEAQLIFPGFALQYAMNSATFFAGKDEVTSMTLGVRTSPATGAMSLTMSKLRFL